MSIADHFRHIRNARRFGAKFLRRRSFCLPDTVRIGGKTHRLYSLQEHGCKADFLACIIEDQYGLASIHKEVKTILDIGGNLGYFSLAARSYFPRSIIHCYEPNPRVLPLTRQNATSGGILLFEEAVGSSEGSVTIDELGDCNLARTKAGGDIPRVSLHTAIERLGGHVDLAKIDCEGAEWDLLSTDSPWEQIETLRMEYHLWDGHTLHELTTRLDSLGFRVDRIWPGPEYGMVWASRRQ